MTTLITYGTFDLLHIGHIRLLARLKNLASKVIVGLSTDDFNHIKGKKCIISWADRKEMLLATKYVDHVFPENEWEQKRRDIIEYKADLFAMGDDWVGHFDSLNDITKVVYLARTPCISTTNLKEALLKYNADEINSIRRKLHEIDAVLHSMSKNANEVSSPSNTF